MDGVNHGEAVSKQVLDQRTGVLQLELGGDITPAWIKLNPGQVTMMRVLYPASMLEQLRQALLSGAPSMSASDRLGLQNDAFALTRAGLMSTAQLLELVNAYINENDSTVWTDLIANLNELGVILRSKNQRVGTNKYSTYELFCMFVIRLLRRITDTVGWDKQPNEAHVTALLRSKLIATMGKYGDDKTISEAVQRFLKHFVQASNTNTEQKQEENASLSADLRDAVYSMVTYRHLSGFMRRNVHLL